MGNIKEINIKNRTYCFFDDMINIKNFNSILLKVDKSSYKNIDIYYIGYVTMKDSTYVNIHSVNPLYFITGEVDGPIEEKNGNKHLVFATTDKNEEVLAKYSELWDKIKDLYLKKIDNKPDECGKDYIKIKFNLDDNLSLKKIVILFTIFLDECLYEL